MPESYVFCKGVQMTTVADQLDNAGFNAIAKSPLLEPTYIINQGKHLSKWTSRLQCRHFLCVWLFCLIFAFLDYIQMCVLFVMTASQSSPLKLFWWSVLKCYQYSFDTI